MKTKVLQLKNRITSSGGTVAGLSGSIGSLHNVCHWLCMGVVSMLAIFGITTSILPLMFLEKYQSYFWWMALVFTLGAVYFYQKQKKTSVKDRNLILINSGLLTFSLPFVQMADYMDFFRFVGGSLALAGIFLIFFKRKVLWADFQATKLESQTERLSKQSTAVACQTLDNVAPLQLPKFTFQSALFAIVIGGFLFNQILMYQTGIFDNVTSSVASTAHSVVQTASRMKLSPFDVVLAKERMDENGDGICDVCGMPLEQCIDGGQIDCNMANDPNAIGVLGSQHIHADWKIYINGDQFDWSPFADLHANQMAGDTSITNTSAFMHIHPAEAPEEAGAVLHMHASNVPLWLFFRSMGMSLTKNSLTLTDGRVLKNENGNTLKFYVNGQKIEDLENHVFADLDKIVISYGPENDPETESQLKSVTSFSGNH